MRQYERDPRVDAYIDGLPEWQHRRCQDLRDLIHGADPEMTETIKRVRHGSGAVSYATAVDDALERIEAVTELKTAWHPVGA